MGDGEGAVPARRPGAPTEATETDDVGGPSAVAAPLGQGAVVLSRVQEGYRDALRRYAVLIDDTQVGSIGRGQTLRFEVPSGTHQLQLKIAWCSSQPLTAIVEPGKTVCFTCSPGGDASEGLVAVGADRGDYIACSRRRSRLSWPRPRWTGARAC